jgi:hypothetical protein
MATITEKPAPQLSASSAKVRDPLQKLRFYIRAYATSEVLATLLMCLAVFFWISLLLDYGSFLLGLDWVRDTPRGFRAALLGLGLLLVFFIVEIRKMIKRDKALAGRAGPISIEVSLKPNVERNLSRLRTGIGVVLFSLILWAVSWALIVIPILSAFTPGAAADSRHAGTMVLAGIIGLILSSIVGFVGKLVCLTSSAPSSGRLFLLVAAVADGLSLALNMASLVMALPVVVQLAGVLLGLLGYASFLAYLRDVALFMGKRTLATVALVVLALTALIVLLYVAIIVFALSLSPTTTTLAQIELVVAAFWFVSYLGLLSGLAIQGRTFLAIAIATPIVLVYLAAWIALALWRDSGGLNGAGMGLMVAGLLAGFTAMLVLKRLLYDFADESLALVLERQFPNLLGDRLITAVELADTKAAARYGYSEAMIEQTIHEAAETVGMLNIHEVFDWKRLYVRAALAVLLTVGLYALAFGSLAIAGASMGKDVGTQFAALNDGASIWFERNVLLNNERWPTRSMVELVGFPASGELKKGKAAEGGKDLTRVDLRCVAHEYVIHDTDAPECWRPVLLSDLGKLGVVNADILDSLPHTWTPESVDQLKLLVQRFNDGDRTLAAPNAATQAGLDVLFAELDSVAEQTSMSRTLRKLIVPGTVYVEYRSDDGFTRATASMQPRANNEFTTELQLKDSVTFYLTAEDYVGESRKITLVPPPRIYKLDSIERQPAYLYQLSETDNRIMPSVLTSTVGLLAAPGNALVAASALPEERAYDDDRFFLGSRKQLVRPRPVNVTGELKPKIPVPATTDVTLEAETDKDIDPKSVVLDGKGSPSLQNVKPVVTGPRKFKIVIPNVKSELEFRLEFRDTDGALGIQELQITIDEDSPPVIDQFSPVVVREVNGKYKVTPDAFVPFLIHSKDPRFGLASLEYSYSIKETPSPGEQARRAQRAAAGVGLMLGGPEAPLSSYVYNLYLPGTLKGNEEVLEGRQPVADFKTNMDRLRRFRDPEGNVRRTMADTIARLDQPINYGAFPKMFLNYNLPDVRALDKFLNDHDLPVAADETLKSMDLSIIRRVDASGLSVPLKARPLEIQRKYDMIVTLVARDTNVSKPRRGQHESQPIPFEIVSEIELLFEINQEEQRLYDELFKSVADLRKAFEQLQSLKFDIRLEPVGGRPTNFDAYSVRTEDVQKVLKESQRMTVKVLKDYEKILQELRTNRIEKGDAISKTKKDIVGPLTQIINGDYRLVETVGGQPVPAGFPVANDGLKYLREEVDNIKLNEVERLKRSTDAADGAEKDLNRLLTALNLVLNEMAGVVQLGEILKGLNELELKERDSIQKIETQKIIQTGRIFDPPTDKKP